MQGRGSVIHGIDIKLSVSITETCDTLFFSGAGKPSRVSGPPVNEKGDWLTCQCKIYPGLHRGDESQVLGPGAPSVFSSKSEEAGQSWVGGLLLRTRRGCLDPWRVIWAVNLPVSLYASAGTWTWKGP